MSVIRTCTVVFDTLNLVGEKISSGPIEIYVDNQNWTNTSVVVKLPNAIQVTFDEAYILTQRIVTFKAGTLKAETICLVKARVYKNNDIVVKTIPSDVGTYSPLPSYGKQYRDIEGAFTEEFTQTYGTGKK